MPRPLSKPRRFILASILVVGSLTFSLIAAETFLKYFHDHIKNSNRRETGLIGYDATLGWKLNRNWKGNHRHYDFDVQYATNQYGFRGSFAKKRSESDRIYAFVGDSFTFSYGATEGETFIDQLNLTRKDKGELFYNFGVPGYSTDQELLLIKERVFTFNPDVIFLVVYLHNDLVDNERPFPIQSSHGKPYFELTASGLQLRNTPVPLKTSSPEQRHLDLARLLLGNNAPNRGTLVPYLNRFELTRWMVPFIEETPDITAQLKTRLGKNFRLFYALVDQILEECRKRNVELRLVLMPGRSFVERPASISAHYQNYVREQILKSSAKRDEKILDLAGYLQDFHEREGTRLYHPNEGHLNLDGHRTVADFFTKRLP